MSSISNKDIISIVVVFTTVFLAAVVTGQQLTPLNLVTRAGTNLTSMTGMMANQSQATFSCTGPANEAVTWSVSTPTLKKIYQSLVGYIDPSYASHYQVNHTNNGQSTLTVLNPNLDDGIAVSCGYTSTNDVYANLIVIERPTSTVLLKSTMQPVSSSETLTAGTEVILQCRVNYASPTTDGGFSTVLNPEPPTPEVTMYLNNNEKVQDAKYVLKTGVPGLADDSHSITVQKNYTLTAQDSGKLLRCTVATLSPAYSDTTNTSISSQSTTMNIQISIGNGTNTVLVNHESVNCSADGYPVPYVSWVPLSSNLVKSDGKAGYGSAVLTPSTPGNQWWNCTATQNISGIGAMSGVGVGGQVVIARDVRFTAINNGTDTEPSKASTDSVGLGVGLGIGLGVPILLGLIILVVVLMKRKKAKTPPAYSVSKAETKSSPKKNSAAPPADKITNIPGTKSPNDSGRAKRPDPQPPTNGTAPPIGGIVSGIPDPGAYTMAHGTRPGRDSPGYGDLGMRPVGGSGSIPQLNESYDNNANRSFDRQLQAPPSSRYQNHDSMGDPNTQV